MLNNNGAPSGSGCAPNNNGKMKPFWRKRHVRHLRQKRRAGKAVKVEKNIYPPAGVSKIKHKNGNGRRILPETRISFARGGDVSAEQMFSTEQVKKAQDKLWHSGDDESVNKVMQINCFRPLIQMLQQLEDRPNEASRDGVAQMIYEWTKCCEWAKDIIDEGDDEIQEDRIRKEAKMDPNANPTLPELAVGRHVALMKRGNAPEGWLRAGPGDRDYDKSRELADEVMVGVVDVAFRTPQRNGRAPPTLEEEDWRPVLTSAAFETRFPSW